ncbi:MAG: Rne/Rng family ribonuclease [Alphaproteobacteria bacterium]
MRRMLIDATHLDETRVAILDGTKLDDFEAETADKTQNKGNLYVGVVSRVEPSLQAAFITYGGTRNGFLAFGEVHPQFFAVPDSEKAELLEEITEQAERRRGHLRDDGSEGADEAPPADDAGNTAEGGSDEPRSDRKRQPGIYRRYRIQDVLKEGQKILVQVVKEERGSKGAALTSYVSMPGRYTVLMPNTPFAGGISRKISDPEERRTLRDMYAAMKVPNHMGLIIRTAGVGQPVDAVVNDYKNMRTLWDNIIKAYETTDDVACVHEDGTLIIRALRDMLREDIEEVVISGKRAYKVAKDYTKALMPDAAKLIKEYKDETPLFTAHKVEQKLNQLNFSRVQLPSGGYMIIDHTEALVAVDINSGRNTHERNIEETAVKTNLEACDELGRHIRLRDLAGLIVVDFIDMEDYRNVRKVEQAMRKVLRKDRARVQYTDISEFGLMEISRQRLRPSLSEHHFISCPHCNGTGQVHSPASAALMVLRRLEEEDCRGADRVVVHAATSILMWIMNSKRAMVADLEAKNKYHLVFKADDTLLAPDHRLELVTVKADGSENIKKVEVILREQPELPPEQRYKQHHGAKGGRDRDDAPRGERPDRERRPRSDRDEPRTDAGRAEGGDEPRRDRNDRNGGRGRDDNRGGRDRNHGGRGRGPERERPRRMDDEAPMAEMDAPMAARAAPSLDEVKQAIKRPTKQAEAKHVHVAPPAPPAEDKPLEVAKVAVVTDDDTPVIVAKRKKMEVKKQADTDSTDEPLKVVKLAVAADAVEETPVPAKAKPRRKGLLGGLLG